MTDTEALRLDGVRKVHGTGDNQVIALAEVSLSLAAGTFTAVMGPSGSGKSTLLQCAAGLERPTAGRVFVAGRELAGSETELTRFRREHVGFVFQQFNLLPALTVLQNVTLPVRLAGKRVDARRVAEVLDQVGLGDRLTHRPQELSGGQQQRVAIARALVTSPSVIFADEPTGALDIRSARAVLKLFQQSVRVYGQTLVLVTHDPIAAAHADSVLFLADGRIVGHLVAPTAEAVAERLTHLGEDLAGKGV
ncbi:ABC transporter ATP-binding protein [Actinomadura craniellae]|uniref:ABC transporter ATP-binding protein n=1 Tax=Actinomadura craniellae TaxID=2231787 RepID=A0A365H3W6_9ACTN|nr:ABC transporter ATP-binding protein [Actinomadura craniellae]RAY13706.1 ABC transporter ATP-binding protein [Actinomadura craniellae]